MAATSQAIEKETRSAEARRDGWLVIARYCPPKGSNYQGKTDFPIYTVICDDPDDAIDYVREAGFSFSEAFVIRAVHVGLVGGKD